MIFGIVKESLEICVFLINDVLIFVIQKKSHFQELAGEVTILERFCVRTVCNVTPIQGSENDIFMKTELLAWDLLQKLKKSHSHVGGVAKVANRIPTLHGSQKKK